MWRLLALAAGSCLVAADNLDHVIKLHSTIEDAKLSNQRSRLRRLAHVQSNTPNSSSNHNNPNDPNNPNASHNAQPGGAPNSASTNNNAPPNASASASRSTSSGGQQYDPNAKPVPSEVSSHNTNARKGLNNGIPDGRTPRRSMKSTSRSTNDNIRTSRSDSILSIPEEPKPKRNGGVGNYRGKLRRSEYSSDTDLFGSNVGSGFRFSSESNSLPLQLKPHRPGMRSDSSDLEIPLGDRGDPIARLSRGSFEVIPVNLKSNLYPPKKPAKMPIKRNNRHREKDPRSKRNQFSKSDDSALGSLAEERRSPRERDDGNRIRPTEQNPSAPARLPSDDSGSDNRMVNSGSELRPVRRVKRSDSDTAQWLNDSDGLWNPWKTQDERAGTHGIIELDADPNIGKLIQDRRIALNENSSENSMSYLLRRDSLDESSSVDYGISAERRMGSDDPDFFRRRSDDPRDLSESDGYIYAFRDTSLPPVRPEEYFNGPNKAVVEDTRVIIKYLQGQPAMTEPAQLVRMRTILKLNPNRGGDTHHLTNPRTPNSHEEAWIEKIALLRDAGKLSPEESKNYDALLQYRNLVDKDLVHDPRNIHLRNEALAPKLRDSQYNMLWQVVKNPDRHPAKRVEQARYELILRGKIKPEDMTDYERFTEMIAANRTFQTHYNIFRLPNGRDSSDLPFPGENINDALLRKFGDQLPKELYNEIRGRTTQFYERHPDTLPKTPPAINHELVRNHKERDAHVGAPYSRFDSGSSIELDPGIDYDVLPSKPKWSKSQELLPFKSDIASRWGESNSIQDVGLWSDGDLEEGILYEAYE